MASDPPRIAFVGAGNMAEALIRGVLHAGLTTPDRVVANDVVPERLDFMRTRYGVRTATAYPETLANADAILLAVKPQQLESAAPLRDALTQGQLVLSILAGKTIAGLRAALGPKPVIVRVMPNLPAQVGAGAAALALPADITPAARELALAIFRTVGSAVELPEPLLDAVTGLSGSGPGFVYAFVEALTVAGVQQGIPADIAATLAASTVYGAAKLLIESGESAATLRQRVTSLGGTTLAGLTTLERDDFAGVIARCVDAATRRSRELAS